ncbi:MAG: DUF3782 domain-containing protein [Candidatus Competibacteraceae bacterium]|nr:DUF3782 domain-containing protein [Candidatus Competibacteraceae bacterium]MCP5125316.1 DUF3782 domain-containing protein [Gammaproteobacteria bacterium]HRX71677.1 DUF3782 domain-containing protein [Candidatus Competibacteraceae bacterium]
MTVEELKARLQTELPELLKQDQSFKQWLEQLIRQTAITPESFDARFERMLQEFAADRAEQRRKWDEQNRKWDEHTREFNEWGARFDAHVTEQRRKWDEQNRKWDEQNRKWDEQNRKWDEQNRTNQKLLDEIALSRSRQEQGISALGSRWGLASEHSFRNALKGILEKSFGVEVLNINEFDDEGLVFGRPDQVEIDIIIKNGETILCELKSSMSKGDMYIFDRKAQYYERRHQRPIQRKLVISPMVHPTARPVAEKLGIEVFSYVEDATGF